MHRRERLNGRVNATLTQTFAGNCIPTRKGIVPIHSVVERKVPLLGADFAIKFMADTVKEERMYYLRISQSVSGIVTLHSTRSETARLTMK